MGRAVGIDLGTTNSVVAVLEGTSPAVVINAEGSRTTPSVVAFTEGGEVLVGRLAKNQAVTNPDNTIRSAKRHIGTDWSTTIFGKHYNSQEISARILQKLKRDAETYLGEEVTDAVITVPAYFNDSQRIATKEAGTIAGLNVLRIINEPTAAALAYGLKDGADGQTVLVFDLGGGTFDVSILDIGDGMFDVRSTSGDTQLGGDDWDDRIIDWLTERFLHENGVDLANDNMTLQRLKEAAEDAKISLSQMEGTKINLPYVTTTDAGPLHLDLELTRSDFQQITDDLLERCRGPVEQALADAGLSADEIDQVILVGGSTRMPAVVDLVTDMIGTQPHQGVNPDEVVALGAATQSGVLRGEMKEVLLLDVTPLSLGVETFEHANQEKGDGMFSCIIERNTTVPTNNTKTYRTLSDNQTLLAITVLQGDEIMARDNKELGEYLMEGLTPRPKGETTVDITFDIDSDGIIHITAREQGSDRELNVTVEGHSALDSSSLDSMMASAQSDLVRLK